MNLNKAMIIGNLTRDPETRTTPQGINVTSFSVATNLIWNDSSGQRQEKAEFHNVVAWRKLADICAQYLKKGSKVYIEGRLQTRDWEGQDGVRRYRTEIIADNMIMLDRAGSAPASSPAQPQTESVEETAIPAEDTSPAADKKADEGEDIKIENIPF